jgi:hypothetical protein
MQHRCRWSRYWAGSAPRTPPEHDVKAPLLRAACRCGRRSTRQLRDCGRWACIAPSRGVARRLRWRLPTKTKLTLPGLEIVSEFSPYRTAHQSYPTPGASQLCRHPGGFTAHPALHSRATARVVLTELSPHYGADCPVAGSPGVPVIGRARGARHPQSHHQRSRH